MKRKYAENKKMIKKIIKMLNLLKEFLLYENI